MAAIDFPANPATNDTHVANGRTFQYDGTVWVPVAGAIEIGDGTLPVQKLKTDSAGTTGQVLTRTGNGMNWANASGGVDSFDQQESQTGGSGTGRTYTMTFNQTADTVILNVELNSGGSRNRRVGFMQFELGDSDGFYNFSSLGTGFGTPVSRATSGSPSALASLSIGAGVRGDGGNINSGDRTLVNLRAGFTIRKMELGGYMVMMDYAICTNMDGFSHTSQSLMPGGGVTLFNKAPSRLRMTTSISNTFITHQYRIHGNKF